MRTAVFRCGLATMWAVCAAAAAQATPIDLSFSLSGDSFSEPGLAVRTDTLGGTAALDLDVGQSVRFDLFSIWTDETKVHADDVLPGTLVAGFDLGLPGASGQLSGTTLGHSEFFDIFQWGTLSWDEPLVLTFGRGGAVSILLSNALFNFGFFGLAPGPSQGAQVTATVTYLSAPAAVPLPAGGFLLLGGLGGLACVRRRKQP